MLVVDGACTLAEPSIPLLTQALTRLAGALEGLPLLGSRVAAGAFPATATGKQAARFSVEQGLVRFLGKVAVGKTAVEHYTLSEDGRHWLREEADSSEVLKGLAAALEQRSTPFAVL